MMDAKELQTLVLGLSSIVGIIHQKTAGDTYWDAVIDRFNTDIKFAGQGLEWLFRANDDTQEVEALVVENAADTKEFPAVKLYDANGMEVA